MKRLFLLGLAAGLLLGASPSPKFLWAGRFAVSPAGNSHLTLPFSMRGQLVKADCHDDAGVPAPLDSYLGVGRSDGGMGLGTGPCLQADGGQVCPLVRFSLGEGYREQQLSTEDTVWGVGTDAGLCDVWVAGN